MGENMFTKSLEDFFKKPLMIIPFIIPILFISLCLYFLEINGFLQETNKYSITTGFEAVAGIIMLIMLILTPYFQSWGYLNIKQTVVEGFFDFNKNAKNAFKYFLSIFAIDIFKTMVNFAVFIVLVFIFAIFSAVLTVMFNEGALIYKVFESLVGILVISIIFYFNVVLAPVKAILVFDDVDITVAISKGFKYGNKKIKNLFGISIFVAVIIIILSNIFYLIGLEFLVLTIALWGLAYLNVYIVYSYGKDRGY